MTAEPLKRITFAIVSHPDAGKTTLTEKLLLFSGVIQLAGVVKGKKSKLSTTSDWMELEKQRGISVSTSVMQFEYRDYVINLLDTPGHADFSEDTYRTLTAVDAVLMVIDGAKGVESRTIKLLEVCRLRDIPILTFINKMDREAKDPVDLIDEIETTLKISCSPINWPIGMGKSFKGIYDLYENKTYLFEPGDNDKITNPTVLDSLEKTEEILPDQIATLKSEINVIKEVTHEFDLKEYLAGHLTPVFFGSAINNFGVKHLLDKFVDFAPPIQPRLSETRKVEATEDKFTGFVFKIQANMDPAHRDRIAFIRICSGKFEKGMRLFHVRSGKYIKVNQALTFVASNREQAEIAYPGDVIGIHNHGTIQIGDTFTEGEVLKFTGIPHFAPELFKRVRSTEPMKQKSLLKGLKQLSEEGATQILYHTFNNEMILGAVGILQFDVVAFRLKHEYNVDCAYDATPYLSARWFTSPDAKKLEAFKDQYKDSIATDIYGNSMYLIENKYLFKMICEKWPDITFVDTQQI